jgi:protein subunit release factor B
MEQGKDQNTYCIPSSDDDLLSECDVETFCSTGPGGQNVNKRETAVRLRHHPSGIVVTCQEERAQYRNKKIALEILRRKLIVKLRKKRPRIPTVLPEHVREKILEKKKLHSRKKMNRSKPITE